MSQFLLIKEITLTEPKECWWLKSKILHHISTLWINMLIWWGMGPMRSKYHFVFQTNFYQFLFSIERARVQHWRRLWGKNVGDRVQFFWGGNHVHSINQERINSFPGVLKRVIYCPTLNENNPERIFFRKITYFLIRGISTRFLFGKEKIQSKTGKMAGHK